MIVRNVLPVHSPVSEAGASTNVSVMRGIRVLLLQAALHVCLAHSTPSAVLRHAICVLRGRILPTSQLRRTLLATTVLKANILQQTVAPTVCSAAEARTRRSRAPPPVSAVLRARSWPQRARMPATTVCCAVKAHMRGRALPRAIHVRPERTGRCQEPSDAITANAARIPQLSEQPRG